MKPKKVLNSFDQSSGNIIEAMSAVNDPEANLTPGIYWISSRKILKY